MTNKVQDAFDQIEASEGLKSSTVQFLQTEREKRSRSRLRHPVWRTALAAACAMLVLFVSIGGYYTTQTPVSYVSIDVNPSVELALNRYDRVISVTAYNEDGEIILEGVHVKGKLYTDAINVIVGSDAMKPYLSKDAALTFTVAASDSMKKHTILIGIQNCSGYRRHGGQSFTTDVTSIAAAHNCGLSFGKYAAYLALSQYDSSITTEDCHNMSMAEIHDQISEHEQARGHYGDSSGDANGHKGNGSCDDNGGKSKHGRVSSQDGG